MKIIKMILPLAIGALCFFSYEASAQEQTEMSKEEHTRMDSMETVYERDKIKTQRQEEAEKMTDLKNERNDTKANAKAAQRVENDAKDAAKESKNAYKAEKKAQKARTKADKQATTAEDAREKSDQN
jgi:hypothetical protein